jgi:hypothetical protein
MCVSCRPPGNVQNRTQQAVQSAYNSITSSVNSNMIRLMDGQESVGRAFQKIWESVANTAVESVMKQIEAHYEGLAVAKASAAIQKLLNISMAGSGAVAATAPVPFIGPAIAPFIAAGMVGPAAGFEKGGVVPQTGMALVHKGEAVIPAHITTQLMKSPQMAPSSSNLTVNYNPSVSGINTAGIKDMLDQNGKLFMYELFRQWRRTNQ